MLTTLGLVLVLISILPNPINSGLLEGLVGSEDMNKNMKAFDNCHGQETGVSRIAKARITTLATKCFIGQTKKYCQYRCVAEEMGTIDPKTGKPNEAGIKKLENQLEDFEGKKEVMNGVRKCMKNKIYHQTKDCKSAREFYYCAFKNFMQICHPGDPLPKESREESTEDNDDDTNDDEKKGGVLGLLGS